jgi:hypothetical protein
MISPFKKRQKSKECEFQDTKTAIESLPRMQKARLRFLNFDPEFGHFCPEMRRRKKMIFKNGQKCRREPCVQRWKSQRSQIHRLTYRFSKDISIKG